MGIVALANALELESGCVAVIDTSSSQKMPVMLKGKARLRGRHTESLTMLV